MNVHKPDPRRQVTGAINKAHGKQFEQRLDAAFEYYSRRGFAAIEKTPEPLKPIRPCGNGTFVAVFTKKAQPDYKGTLKGGRSIMFEAKYTSGDRIEQSRVTEGQTEYMNQQSALGARCYVVVGFASGAVYRVPWAVWCDMKTMFGRKYVTEKDLTAYVVASAWNDVLELL